jgi:hypothetical protein
MRSAALHATAGQFPQTLPQVDLGEACKPVSVLRARVGGAHFHRSGRNYVWWGRL